VLQQLQTSSTNLNNILLYQFNLGKNPNVLSNRQNFVSKIFVSKKIRQIWNQNFNKGWIRIPNKWVPIHNFGSGSWSTNLDAEVMDPENEFYEHLFLEVFCILIFKFKINWNLSRNCGRLNFKSVFRWGSSLILSPRSVLGFKWTSSITPIVKHCR
jgi:hypothetical protein